MLSRHGLSYLARDSQVGDDRSPPTLVLLHGFGMHQNYLFDLTLDFDARFAVVGLQAPLRIGPGAYRWFHFDQGPDGNPIIDDAEEASSLRKLTGFLEALKAERCPGPLYLFGHSQGGMMSFSIALSRPDLIAGCAQLSSRILSKVEAILAPLEAIRGVPFFVGHGVDDAVVPVRQGRAARERLRRLDVDLDYHEYSMGHEISPEVLADVSNWLTARLDGCTRQRQLGKRA